MRLYHYTPRENTVLKQGLYSYSRYPNKLKRGYSFPAKSNKKKDIIAWMEKIFPGRSKAISCLTEPIKWYGNDNVLKNIVKRSSLVSFELEDLIKAGLVESIWCRDDLAQKGRKYTYEKHIQYYHKVTPEKIDTSPLLWEKVDINKEIMWGAVRHYMIVLKKGVIPPEYLKLEKNDLGLFCNLSQFIKRLFTRKK